MAYVVLLITENNTVAASPLQYVYIILFAILIKHLNRAADLFASLLRFALYTLTSAMIYTFFPPNVFSLFSFLNIITH
ncbi:hypothetical protein ACJX0J_014553, partial [Zea mays]